MTPVPIRALKPPARLLQSDPTELTAEIELVRTNLALWRELPDEAFEQHFRERYFGNEPISRQEAIDRLIGMIASTHEPLATDATAVECATESHAGSESSETTAAVPFADVQIIILPARPISWHSVVLSILTHGLVLWLLLCLRLPARGNRFINFDTETITYYKVSDAFPSVAPSRPIESSNPSESRPQTADSRTRQTVRVRPRAASETETVIEQPEFRQVSTLPKLQLPNILLQTSKMDPGREPLVVSADVLRHLAIDVQQPRSLGNLPQNSTQTLAARQPTLPLPQLAAPAEPTRAALPVDQVAREVSRFQAGGAPLPYAAPPVEDAPVGFQTEAIPAEGPNLLVFSATPALPKGEIAVPKASSTGRLTGSSSQPTLPQGAAELSRAEVIIPAISISGRTPPAVGSSTAVVQAPVPKPPVVARAPSPAAAPSLLDSLPSRIPSGKPLPSGGAEIGAAASPLQDYESRGGVVYTAAINAPNFTSKRGSWIFRFAELLAPSPASSSTVPGPLTAPSASVKVDPKYAPEVVREKREGVVILFAILRKDGVVDGESVRVIRKLDSRLDESARDALLNWRFKPSERNGIAVDIQMEVSIPFYFRREAQ